ncbi:hypothetical protein ABW19_dt0205143 [Dactylella cylindrospora]|nr:hypothetical protein ABW19_dt0205143 [Dactylella cylindrospora]
MLQLTEQVKDPSILALLLQKAERSKFKDCSPTEILELTTILSGAFSTTYLVIDGLDECDIPEDRRNLLDFISNLGRSPHGSIKSIATSRTHLDIKNSFIGFPNISIAARSTDVKLFVAGELENRLHSQVEFYGIELHDPELKGEIISTLVDKASGM